MAFDLDAETDEEGRPLTGPSPRATNTSDRVRSAAPPVAPAGRPFDLDAETDDLGRPRDLSLPGRAVEAAWNAGASVVEGAASVGRSLLGAAGKVADWVGAEASPGLSTSSATPRPPAAAAVQDVGAAGPAITGQAQGAEALTGPIKSRLPQAPEDAERRRQFLDEEVAAGRPVDPRPVPPSAEILREARGTAGRRRVEGITADTPPSTAESVVGQVAGALGLTGMVGSAAARAAREAGATPGPGTMTPAEEAQAQAAYVARGTGKTPEEIREEAFGADPPPLRAAKSFKAGVVGIGEELSKAAQLAGDVTGFKELSQVAQHAEASFAEVGQGLKVSNPTFFNEFAQGAGSMVGFMIPGIGSELVVARMAQVAPRLARVAGALNMAITEALTEAGGVYKGLIDKGVDPREAARAAGAAFAANTALLYVTDKLGFFSENGKKLYGSLRGAAKEMAISAGTESPQEFGQSVIEDVTTGQPVDWAKAFRSAAIGGLVGPGAKGVQIAASRGLPGATEIRPEESPLDRMKRGRPPEEPAGPAGRTSILPKFGEKDPTRPAVREIKTELEGLMGKAGREAEARPAPETEAAPGEQARPEPRAAADAPEAPEETPEQRVERLTAKLQEWAAKFEEEEAADRDRESSQEARRSATEPAESAGETDFEPKTETRIPLIITKKMEADLRARGLSQDEINGMTPDLAHRILAGEPYYSEARPAPKQTQEPAAPAAESEQPATAPVTFQGLQERPGGKPPYELWNLTEPWQGHPKGSTLTREYMEARGATLPPTPTDESDPEGMVREPQSIYEGAPAKTPVPDDIKAMTFYHATSTDEAGQSILADRQLKPGESKGKGFLAPIPGNVYVTNSKGYAATYALGGDFKGHDGPPGRQPGRRGYVFEVSGADLQNIHPDEDAIGGALWNYYTMKKYPDGKYQDKDFPMASEGLVSLAERTLNKQELQNIRGGEYIWFARAGKRLLPRMSDEMKFDLIRKGAHIGNRGPLPIRRAWRLDQSKSRAILPDGSNLFDVAEEVPFEAAPQADAERRQSEPGADVREEAPRPRGEAHREAGRAIGARHGAEVDLGETHQGDLVLNHIEVPKAQRKQGIGSAAMRDLVDYADQQGKRMILSPAVRDDAMGTTSRSRLVQFYKRFGFRENKGRAKDFTISAGMYRDPGARSLREEAAEPYQGLDRERQLPRFGYHAAPTSLDARIQRQGIKADRAGRSYVWSTPEAARWFAEFQNDEQEPRTIWRVDLRGHEGALDPEWDDPTDWTTGTPPPGESWIVNGPIKATAVGKFEGPLKEQAATPYQGAADIELTPIQEEILEDPAAFMFPGLATDQQVDLLAALGLMDEGPSMVAETARSGYEAKGGTLRGTSILPELKEALRMAEGPSEAGSDWYWRVWPMLKRLYPGTVTVSGKTWNRADLAAELLTVTSAGRRTEISVDLSDQVMRLLANGRSPKLITQIIKPSAVTAPKVRADVLRVLKNGETHDQIFTTPALKLRNFNRAIRGDRTAVVVDRWMWRLFYPKQWAAAEALHNKRVAEGKAKGTFPGYTGTDAQYRAIADWITEQAGRFKMMPADMQAKLWITMKRESNDPGSEQPFREMLKERIENFDKALKYRPKPLRMKEEAARPYEGERREREFSSTQIDLPAPLAREIRRWVDATIDPADLAADEHTDRTPHVTVKYGLHTQDPAALADAAAAAGPVEVRLGAVGVFEDDPDHDVLKLNVTSPDLHALNAEVGKLPATDTYDEYRPHVTLAFLKKGTAEKYRGRTPFEGREFTAKTIQFSDRERKKTSIPLGEQEPESPMAMTRVESEGGTRAVAGIDPRLMDVLSGNLYSGDLGQVAAKEMLQNAVDSVRGPGAPAGGFIRLTADTIKKTMTVEDNGEGMTVGVATKEFVDVGGSKKAEGASGGFGIAKMAILGNADEIDVETHHRGPNEVNVTRLRGSRQDWINPERGLAVDQGTKSREAATGTRVTLRFRPEVEMNRYTVRQHLADFLAFHRLPFTFEFIVDGERVEPTSTPTAGLQRLDTVEAPGAKIDFHASVGDTRRTSYVSVQILNNGLPQFRKSVFINKEIRMPALIVADIKATGSPEQMDYPFRPDREGLRADADRAVNRYVSGDLAKRSAQSEGDELRRAFKERSHKIPGTSLYVVDTGLEFPDDVIRNLIGPHLGPMARRVRSTFLRLRDVAEAHPDEEHRRLYARPTFYGYGTQEAYLAANIKTDHVLNQPDGNIVILNPWTHVRHMRQMGIPITRQEDHLAQQIVASFVHELTHQAERGHDENFSSELTYNFGALLPAAAREARELARWLKRNPEIIAGFGLDLDEREGITDVWRRNETNELFGKIGSWSVPAGPEPIRGEAGADRGAAGGPGPEGALRAGEPGAPAVDRAAALPERAAAVARAEASPAFQDWFRGSAVVDAQGRPQIVYRGDYRADRIGDRLRIGRTTSGRFYFTDDPAIASGYTEKFDHGATEEAPMYADWFKVRDPFDPRRKIPLRQLWSRLSPAERDRVKDTMLKAGENEGEFDFTGEHRLADPSHWDYTIRDARGDWIMAGVDNWMNAGTLFNDEERFVEILNAAGIEGVEFDDPRQAKPAVLPAFLSIKHPLDTADIPPRVVEGLRAMARRDRTRQRPGMTQWDKTINAKDFVAALDRDLADGTTFAWTTIPEKVTKALQAMGYDGVKDSGGKYTGVGHTVWIAFEPTQVKSIFNRGTWDPRSPYLLREEPAEPYAGQSVATTDPAVQALTDRLDDLLLREEAAAPYDARTPLWYSRLTRLVESRMPNAAPAAQVRGLIVNGGLKPDEVKWSNVLVWLSEKTGNVTRDEVLAHLADNGLAVEESLLGPPPAGAGGPVADIMKAPLAAVRAAKRKMDQALKDLGEDTLNLLRKRTIRRPDGTFEFPSKIERAPRGTWLEGVGGEAIPEKGGNGLIISWPDGASSSLTVTEAGKRVAAPFDQAEKDNHRALYEVYKARREEHKQALTDAAYTRRSAKRAIAGTRHERYALKGGTKYRELRLIWKSAPPGVAYTYPPHWGSLENVVAHVLFKERRVGKLRVLAIEELQSDWHEAGRKRGYIGAQRSVSDIDREMDAINDQIESLIGLEPDPRDNPFRGATQQQYLRRVTDQGVRDRVTGLMAQREALQAERNDAPRGDVPPAPWAKTEEWTTLILRRMTRWAADHGFDAIAWPPGSEIARKYNIEVAQRVDRIDWFRTPAAQGQTTVTGFRRGEVVFQRSVRQAELPDLLGQNMAGQIERAYSDGEARGTLTDLDQLINRSGMEAFYDTIVVNAANKFVGQWKAKVEDLEISILDRDQEGWRRLRFQGRDRTEAWLREQFQRPELWPAQRTQLSRIADHMRDGMTYHDAVSEEIIQSEGLRSDTLTTLGGRLVRARVTKPLTFHAVKLTPEMRQAGRGPMALMERPAAGYEGTAPPPFYSKLERVIEQKMPAQTLVQHVRSILAAGGVKKAERQWSGVDEWLDKQTGKIKRADLLDYLRQNRVEIEEVLYRADAQPGGEGIEWDLNATRVERQWTAQEIADEKAALGIDPDEDWSPPEDDDETATWTLGSRDGVWSIEGSNDAGWWLYRNGEQVAESDLTSSSRRGWYARMHAALDDLRGKAEEILEAESADRSALPLPEEYLKWRAVKATGQTNERALVFHLPGYAGQMPESTHWSDEHGDPGRGIIGHTRVEDLTLPSGDTALMAQELQSDLANEAMRGGIFTPPTPTEAARLEAELGRLTAEGQALSRAAREAYNDVSTGEWPERAARYEIAQAESAARDEEANRIYRLLGQQDITGKVRDVPFLRTWYEPILKRLLRETVEGGYSHLLFPTGAQVAALYNLSAHVRRIEYAPARGTLYFWRTGSNDSRMEEARVEPDRLADYVGTEVAERLMRHENRVRGVPGDTFHNMNPTYALEGEELQIGGTGKKNLYDKQIVNFLNDYVKKWGTRVEDLTVQTAEIADVRIAVNPRGGFDLILENRTERYPTRETLSAAIEKIRARETTTVHAVRITDAMRQSIRTEGQALFESAVASRRRTRAAPTLIERRLAEPGPPIGTDRSGAGSRALQKAAYDLLVQARPEYAAPNGKLERVHGHPGRIAGTVRAEPGVVKIVGLGISDGVDTDGWSEFVGKSVRAIEDIVPAAYMVRSKFFETTRYIAIKDGKVVSHLAVSSGLPGGTVAVPSGPGPRTFSAGVQRLREWVAATGADEVWMLHNHPGGDSHPSPEDLELTRDLVNRIPEIKGHMVINGDNYSVIGRDGRVLKDRARYYAGPDLIADPAIPHGILGTHVSGPETLMKIGQIVVHPDANLLVVFSLDNQSVVRGVSLMHESDFLGTEAKGLLHKLHLEVGARRSVIYSTVKDEKLRDRIRDQARRLIDSNDLADYADGRPGSNIRVGRPGDPVVYESGSGIAGLLAMERENQPYRGRLPDEITRVLRDMGEHYLGTSPDQDAWTAAMQAAIPPRFHDQIDEIWDALHPEDSVSPADSEETALFSDLGPDVDVAADTASAVSLASPHRYVPERNRLLERLAALIDRPIRTGRVGGGENRLGVYKIQPEVIRARVTHDLQTIAHEVGHHISKLVWGPQGKRSAERDAFFDKHGTALDELSQVHANPTREEGWAELWRMYLSNPATLRDVAPELVADAEDVVRQRDEDFLSGLQNWSVDYQHWRGTSVDDRIFGHTVFDPERTRGSLRQTMSRLYTEFVAGGQPIEDATRALAQGRELSPEENAALLQRVLAGAPRLVEMFLFKGRNNRGGAIAYDTRRRVGASLEEVLSPIKNEWRQWSGYMVEKRILEMFRRTDDAARNQRNALLRALELSREQIEAAVAAHETERPHFLEAHDAFQEWNRSLIQYAVDGGLVAPEQAANVIALNQSYFPFHRFFGDDPQASAGGGGGSLANQRSPFQRMQGSGRYFESGIEHAIKNAYTVIMRTERNAVMRSLADLADKAVGAGGIMERVKAPMKVQTVNAEQIEKIKDILRAQGVPQPVIASFDLPGAAEALRSFRPDLFRVKANEGEVWVMRDGVPTHYIVGDPDLYRAVMMLDQREAAFLNKLYSWFPEGAARSLVHAFIEGPANLLRAGATLSPEFMARNPFRDAISRMIYTSTPSDIAVVGPYVDLARGVHGFARGLLSAIRHDEWYDAWVRGGGAISALSGLDMATLQKRREDILRGRDRMTPLHILRLVSGVTEEANRIAEFRDSLTAQGATPETATRGQLMVAGLAARDLADFNRMGSVVKQAGVNRVSAFWNPATQGWDKLYRTLKERPGAFLYRTLMLITLPSLLLWWDNQDDGRWAEIPQWQKDISWIVFTKKIRKSEWIMMTPDERAAAMDDGSIWRIPKPFELGVLFGSLPERIMDSFANMGMLEDVGITPGSTGESGISEAASALGQTLLTSGLASLIPIPTTVAPILGVYANWNGFFGRPVVPRGMQDLEPEYQAGPGTSDVARWIAHGISTVSGGMAKDSLRSPATIDYLLQQYGANLGRLGINTADLIAKSLDPNAPSDPKAVWADVPGVRAFAVRFPSASGASVEEFYRLHQHAQAVLKTAAAMEKRSATGNRGEGWFERLRLKTTYESDVRAYEEKNAFDLTMAPALKATADGLAEIRVEMNEIMLDRTMTPEQKRAALDRATLDMLEETASAVRNYREAKRMDQTKAPTGSRP